MSNEAISNLPAASAALNTDLFAISQGGITKKLTESQLASLIQTQIVFPSSVNIYNSDGSLTADRLVDLNGHSLFLGTSGNSIIQLLSSGTISVISTATLNLYSPLVDLATNSSQLNINPQNINFTSTPFTGGGVQYLTVDNSGKLGADGGASIANIYNSDGSLTASRTVNTNNFPLLFNGLGNVTIDTPESFAAITGSNSFTIGSNTYQGIANGPSQVLKGKFNVVLNDDGGIYSNSFIRFSDSLPVTMVMGKARGNESTPDPIQDGDLLGVFAFSGYDGNTYSGLPNFNLASGMFCIAAPGQAPGNTPGSLLFNVNLSSNPIGTTFMSFNASGNSESLFGQNVTSIGLDSTVLGKDISSTTANEILIGNIVGNVRILSPVIGLESPAISLLSPPYSGAGTQYLTVDNTGLIVPVAASVDTNIYNTDGSLTAVRTLDLNGHILNLGTTFSQAKISLDPSGDIRIGTGSSIEIDALAVNLGSTTHALNIFNSNVKFWATPFVGVSVQYLTVDFSGQLVPVSAPADTNIYNTDGSLTADRTVDLNSHFLQFSGLSSTFNVYTDGINIGSISSQTLTIRATTFINQSGFIGGGNQYIGVNNSGQLITMSIPADTNIYNSDGSLTGNRVVDLTSHSLTFNGVSGTFNIYSNNINIGSISSQTLTIRATTFINQSGFIGGGNQYIGVNNSGQLITLSTADTNIYNTSGTLTGNRTLNLGTSSLTFVGGAGNMLQFNADQINLTVGAGQFNVNSSTVLLTSFAGGGATQYLYVNNSGKLFSTTTPPATNIYNSDGSLTAPRVISLNTNNITFSAATTEQFILDSAVTFNKFSGGGSTQYLYVNNSGVLGTTTVIPSSNIYNTDGTLTGDRTITMGSGGNNFIYFHGGGTFRIGDSLTASGIAVFVQGINNSVSTDRSSILGGQHNVVSGLISGIFASDQCTINTKTGNVGYGAVIASYNTIGFDNFTVSIGTYNSVNYGIRSLILGGQNNKINVSNSTDVTDSIISCGNTNSILANSQNCSIYQSLNAVIGDGTNLISSAYMLNTSNCTLTERNYMVDINGDGNNLSAQNAIVLNGHNCTLTATPGGVLDGRYFMANTNGCSLGIGGGFYASLISCVNTILNGSYCTAISTDSSQFSNVADHSVILGGNGHNMQGVNSAILLGVGNTIGNSSNCGAIGSDINISHANCIMINDGANPLVSSNNNTVIISAGNGVGIGKGVEHPLQDVLLGRKLSVLTLNVAVDFATDTQQAIGYYVDTSGANKTMVLSNADKIGGTLFFVQKTSLLNDLILLPATGLINGLPTLVITGGPKGFIVGSDGTNWYTFGT